MRIRGMGRGPTSPRASAAAAARCACTEEAAVACATAAEHAPPPWPSYRPRKRREVLAGHATWLRGRAVYLGLPGAGLRARVRGRVRAQAKGGGRGLCSGWG